MDFSDGILRKHNQEAYIKLMAAIKEDGKACAVHATGTGKMYLALKWLADNKNESFVYVAPTNVILNKFLDVILEELFPEYSEKYKHLGIEAKTKKVLKLLGNPNIKLLTYAGINSMSEKEMRELAPKRIVLDEFHRCGADKWGESVEQFLSINSSAQILGLSATPIRPSDGKNMVDELFNGKIASQITLETALRDNILPVPMLLCAIYSFEEELKKAEKLILNDKLSSEKRHVIEEKIKEARKIIEQGEGLEQIFSYGMELLHLENGGKFIVFCQNVEDMETKIQECSTWFGKDKKINIYSVDYTKSDNVNLKMIAEFEEDKSENIKLLFSVDMLNEGLHVADIDGVIMLRPTGSNIIFLQQLGRALAVGGGKTPLVFDLVNNIETLNQDIKELATITNNGKRGTSFGDKEDVRFSIQAKLIEIFTFLNNISYTYEDRLAPLLDYYNKYGSIAKITSKDTYMYNGKEVKIGYLVVTLRKQYKAKEWDEATQREKDIRPLTIEEIQLLEKIGMIWEEERTEPLLAYYKEHGTLFYITPEEEYEYNGRIVNIGGLKARFRKLYMARGWSAEECRKKSVKPLTDEEVKILEEIGMFWTWEEERYAPLVDYYKKHGTLAKISTTEVYMYDGREFKIGSLCFRLRQQYLKALGKEPRKKTVSPLSEREIIFLESMGMVWFVDNSFETRIAPLIDYHKKHGTIANIVAKQKYEYNGNVVNVGQLVTSLRRRYKARSWDEETRKKNEVAALTDEQVEMLKKLGMVFDKDPRNIPQVRTKKNEGIDNDEYIEVNTEHRLDVLIDYHKKHGSIENIGSKEEYEYNGKVINVGILVSYLRKQYISRTWSLEEQKKRNIRPLTDQEIQLLESLGMDWKIVTKSQLRLMVLEDYYKNKGAISNISLNDTYEYNGKIIKIGNIIASLRKQYRARKWDDKKLKEKQIRPLNDDEVNLLDSLGMKWEIEGRLAPLIAYYEKYGTIDNITPTTTFEYGGKTINLYTLISNLRGAYKGLESKGTLDQDEIDTLNEMGMIWNVDKSFETRIAPLVDYYKKVGSLSTITVATPLYDYNGKKYNLYNIVVALRSAYKAKSLDEETRKKKRLSLLTDEKIKLLESMGMIWQVDRSFETRIAPLVDYYKKHGTIATITQHMIYNYNGKMIKLGSIITTLRRQYKLRGLSKEEVKKVGGGNIPLTDEQVEILEKMGMIWNAKNKK